MPPQVPDRAPAVARWTCFATYHATWCLPAVRERLVSERFIEDPAWIARTPWPRIKPSEGKQAIDTLLEMGRFARDPHRRRRDAVFSTGAQTQGMHITKDHDDD